MVLCRSVFGKHLNVVVQYLSSLVLHISWFSLMLCSEIAFGKHLTAVGHFSCHLLVLYRSGFSLVLCRRSAFGKRLNAVEQYLSSVGVVEVGFLRCCVEVLLGNT